MTNQDRPTSARVGVLTGLLGIAAAGLLLVASASLAAAALAGGSGESLVATAVAFAVSGGAALIAIGVGAWFTIDRVLAPLGPLRDTAATISFDDLGARVPTAGVDDVVATTRTVNSMLDRLEASAAAQRQLLDDVRHELKTPLTIVRGHLETMDPHDSTDVGAAREIALSELDRMARLVSDIDVLATISGGEPLQLTRIDLAGLTSHVGDLVAAIPGHPWIRETPATSGFDGDRERLVQAWLQLADNAAKHTPPGTAIEVGSAADAGSIRLWVRDHGPGIPPALRHRVFQRFDRAATRRTVGGSGLGLAIVDAIATAHGGACHLTETPGGGATFTIELPQTSDAPRLPAPVGARDVLDQRKGIA